MCGTDVRYDNTSVQVMVEMTNKGVAPDSIVIDGIVDGFVRTGDVGEAISFAQHAFNQVCQVSSMFPSTVDLFELPWGY